MQMNYKLAVAITFYEPSVIGVLEPLNVQTWPIWPVPWTPPLSCSASISRRRERRLSTSRSVQLRCKIWSSISRKKYAPAQLALPSGHDHRRVTSSGIWQGSAAHAVEDVGALLCSLRSSSPHRPAGSRKRARARDPVLWRSSALALSKLCSRCRRGRVSPRSSRSILRLQDVLGGSPSCSACYRFTVKLRENQPALADCLYAVLAALQAENPAFGRDIAIDASDLPAFANGQRLSLIDCPERQTYSDPDASWGHRSAVSTRKGGGFFCYKLQMAVCTRTDLPVAWRIRNRPP